jgi:hypothetical protein
MSQLCIRPAAAGQPESAADRPGQATVPGHAGAAERCAGRDGLVQRMASAVTRYRQDEVASALSHAQQALELFQQTGDRAAQANALNSIGFDHALLGNGQAGLDYCQRALDLCRALGASAVEAETWTAWVSCN